MSDSSLIEYPCDFPIKIMGFNTDTFLNDIRHTALKHFPNSKESAFVYTPSTNHKYVSITVTVHAENKEMLDAFYGDVTKHPEVKMVL